MIDIDAIEKIINFAAGEYMPAHEVSPTLDKAIEQLAAVVANQIKGRCFTCENKNCSCLNVSDTFYCADYKREA